MRFGVIARAEARGLGIQTLEVVRHLKPERVLLIKPQPEGWMQNDQWYAGFPVTPAPWRRGRLREDAVKQWLEGLDVVYTAETTYDPRLPYWAEQVGCAVVRHVNPEQLGPEEWGEHDDPTIWWAATDWRLAQLPPGTRVVPMPVATERFRPHEPHDGPVRFLHALGHEAQDDRAGSRTVARAVRKATVEATLTVRSQDPRITVPFDSGPAVTVTQINQPTRDYWQLYRDHDVFLLPRRYGGLSLPSNEALAAGLVLVMTDCEPNDTWPGPKVAVRRTTDSHMRCGWVTINHGDPNDLAQIMDRLAGDREELSRLQTRARAWGYENSWDALTPIWTAELLRACQSLSRGAAATSTGNVPTPG